MTIHAYKYQGAGNDFIILDNRNLQYNNLTPEQIRLLCDRRFGIGSDGLMLLGPSNRYDFSMRYFNSDGYEGSMCGNGGRCLVAFAAHMGIRKFEFEAIDGYHHAEVLELGEKKCIIKLRMIDLGKYQKYSDNAYFLNTGSPHYVEFVENVMEYPVDEKGKYWRWHKDFEGGTNVDFVEITDNKIRVRTYERGVEAETFACGTGVTASSIATYLHSTKGFASKTTEQKQQAQPAQQSSQQTSQTQQQTQQTSQTQQIQQLSQTQQIQLPSQHQQTQQIQLQTQTIQPTQQIQTHQPQNNTQNNQEIQDPQNDIQTTANIQDTQDNIQSIQDNQNLQIETVTYNIQALGDNLSVSFKYNKHEKTFSDIYLTGPATFVFETDIEITG